MKVLSIVRHGKAERPEGYQNDFSRPLTSRGHKDAVRLGSFMAEIEPPVDFIFSSPAARAAQTADHIAAELGFAKPVAWEESIYQANAEALLDLLRRAPEETEHIALIGHNPGLEELAAGLCSGASDNSVLTLITASLAHFELDIARWSQLRWGAGQLRLLVPAKMLK
jgi:phosphohistidine phosphatase